MANRVATAGDVTTYATWCGNNIDGDAVTEFDAIWDAYTNPAPKGIFYNPLDEDSTFSESLTGAASGNNSGNSTFIVTTTISTSRPSTGAFKVDNGAGGYDVYKYSSFTGSTFTLDATEHPSGLVRTYAGSDQTYAPYLRISFTMWLLSSSFDGDISYFNTKIGETSSILCPSSAPSYFRMLNGKIKFARLNTEASNVCIEIDTDGACIIDGELRSTYPGLRHGISDMYVWNQFGLFLTDTEFNRNVRMCSITGANLKGAGFRGIFTFHGFSGFRCARSNNNQILDFLILERCGSAFGLGERVYFNQTTDNAANPIARKVNISNNIYAYSFNEGEQTQNVSSKGGESYKRNFVSYANGLAWKFSFQPNQDTGNQIENQDADNGNYIENFIIEGYGSYGIQLFSSDKSARGYTAGTGVTKIRNGAILGGRSTGFRIHGSSQYGPATEIRDLYIYNINDTYDELTTNTDLDYWVESADETVPYHFIKVTYNTGKAEFFASTGASKSFASTKAIALTTDDTLPAPQYVNNGFDGIDIEKIEAWNDVATQDSNTGSITAFADAGGGLVTVTSNAHGLLNGDVVDITGTTNYNATGYTISNVTANTFDITATWVADDATGTWSQQIPITYNAGDYVINAPLDVEYAFYVVNNTHTVAIGTTNRPDLDATNYTKVTWDESGVRSNEVGWSSGDIQSEYPPCDFRLVQDSFWSNLKVGLGCQATRSDRTQYQWEYSTDDSIWYEIGDSKTNILKISNYNFLLSGYYVRLKVNSSYSPSAQIP